MGVIGPDLRRAAEAILFVAEEPVPATELAEVLEVPVADVEALLDEMGASYERQGRGFVLRQVAGGYRLARSEARP